VFAKFLARGAFYLVVGVDSVMVPASLDALDRAGRDHENLTVKVFCHERPGSLFHPKLCWFAKEDGGRVFVGSGNLTTGGLVKNWEASSDARLEGADLRTFLDEWKSWLDANTEYLYEVTADEAAVRARRNQGEKLGRHEEEQVEEADADLAHVSSSAEVLLAEIPRSGDRWHQANFNLATFREFFQVTSEKYHRILLFPVREEGTVGRPEVRQGVEVKSQNFRIELGEAAGKAYPDHERPIGAFLRVGTRRFRYRVLMPGEVDHKRAATVLDVKGAGRSDPVRRVMLDLEELQASIPDFLL